MKWVCHKMWNDGIEGKRKHNGGSRKKLLHIAGFQRHISLEKNDAKREEISLSIVRSGWESSSRATVTTHIIIVHTQHTNPLNDYAVQLRATFQYKIKTQLHIHWSNGCSLVRFQIAHTMREKSDECGWNRRVKKMKAKRAVKSPLNSEELRLFF